MRASPNAPPFLEPGNVAPTALACARPVLRIHLRLHCPADPHEPSILAPKYWLHDPPSRIIRREALAPLSSNL